MLHSPSVLPTNMPPASVLAASARPDWRSALERRQWPACVHDALECSEVLDATGRTTRWPSAVRSAQSRAALSPLSTRCHVALAVRPSGVTAPTPVTTMRGRAPNRRLRGKPRRPAARNERNAPGRATRVAAPARSPRLPRSTSAAPHLRQARRCPSPAETRDHRRSSESRPRTSRVRVVIPCRRQLVAPNRSQLTTDGSAELCVVRHHAYVRTRCARRGIAHRCRAVRVGLQPVGLQSGRRRGAARTSRSPTVTPAASAEQTPTAHRVLSECSASPTAPNDAAATPAAAATRRTTIRRAFDLRCGSSENGPHGFACGPTRAARLLLVKMVRPNAMIAHPPHRASMTDVQSEPQSAA
jgi:hypothetical protein